MTNQTNDITELLFPQGDLNKREKLELELWQKATDEASKRVGLKSPLALLRKTEEIYKNYLKEVKYEKS
jgi:hypothetical protein